jgi:hypothetical protein
MEDNKRTAPCLSRGGAAPLPNAAVKGESNTARVKSHSVFLLLRLNEVFAKSKDSILDDLARESHEGSILLFLIIYGIAKSGVYS